MPFREDDRQAWILIAGVNELTHATVGKAVRRRGGWTTRKVTRSTVSESSHSRARGDLS
jgi:hypothetical protein